MHIKKTYNTFYSSILLLLKQNTDDLINILCVIKINVNHNNILKLYIFYSFYQEVYKK